MGDCVSKDPKVNRKAANLTFYNCGLFGAPLKSKSEEVPCSLLPLIRLTYDIDIVNGVAEVSLKQTFHNPTLQYLELEYNFPINPKSCIHKFTAVFGRTRMEGVVKEKEEARIEYVEAVKGGKRAAFAEIEREGFFNLQLGNLAPAEDVAIEIVYTEELSLNLNTFYSFSLPAEIHPSFINTLTIDDLVDSFRKSVKLEEDRKFQWDFRLRLRTSRKITSYQSLKHKVTLEKTNDQKTEMLLTLENGQILHKAFNFIFTTQNIELPSYTLGRTDAGSSVMVSFIPKFCTLALEDAQIAAQKSQGFETDMDIVKGQYIFLLDRSGSMNGRPIQKAKQALILFLKSLPIDTYFQVISFGTKSQFLFQASQRNSNESINVAVQKIQGMSANLGGTDIYKPLEKILTSDVIQGYPKQVFLLTDGAVSNTQSVISLVQSNIRYSRVHTIGVGKSVSRGLITGCAEKGKGMHIFIDNKQDPSEKIIGLLNESLTPVITNIVLDFDRQLVDSVVPNPEKMPYILKGEVANFFLTFKGHLSFPTTIALSYTDSLNKLPYKTQIEVSPNTPSQPFVDTLANFRRIRVLEDAEFAGDTQNYLYYVKMANRKQQIVDLSIKHQILSHYTSFICVEKELVDGKYQEIKDKGQTKINLQSQSFPLKMEEGEEHERNIDKSNGVKKSAKILPGKINDEEKHERNVEKSNGVKKSTRVRRKSTSLPKGIQIFEKSAERQSMEMMAPLEEQGSHIARNDTKSKVPKEVVYNIKQIVKQQLFEGNWNNPILIQHIYNAGLAEEVKQLQDSDAAITYLIMIWIQKNHPGKEYKMIVKKARNWLSKQKRYAEFPSRFDKYIKYQFTII